jgi:diguanylate cyclase (GGDEF)-like protein
MSLLTRSSRPATVASVVLFAAYALVLVIRPGGAGFMMAFGDVALIVTPALAALTSFGAGFARRGSSRRAWLLIGAGCLAWAAGQVIWTGYQLIGHEEMPYPSWADAGYLAFLPLTVAGAALQVNARSGRLRTALDALLISGSLLAVSWAFVLGPIFAGERVSPLTFAVSLAYPIGDVALMTVALLVLGQVRAEGRASVLLLAAGASALSGAHGVYAYLVLHDAYRAGTWVDAGWFGGYLLLGLAALAAPTQSAPGHQREALGGWLVLPYLPLGAAVATSAWKTVRVGTPGTFLYCLTLGLVVLMVARQVVSARDNHLLNRQLGSTLDSLREREAELEYQAFHDSLTGLANRALLEDRTVHALAHQDRSGEPMALIYIDLDGFKKVNDELGHHAGDQLLVEVADRLTGCARTTDTVARLGGDEFAILCERMQTVGDEEVVAARIVERLGEPFPLTGGVAQIGASVGIVRRMPHGASLIQLMRDADHAMYQAKTAGKGRFHRAI